jgi:hypothetical protein
MHNYQVGYLPLATVMTKVQFGSTCSKHGMPMPHVMLAAPACEALKKYRCLCFLIGGWNIFFSEINEKKRKKEEKENKTSRLNKSQKQKQKLTHSQPQNHLSLLFASTSSQNVLFFFPALSSIVSTGSQNCGIKSKNVSPAFVCVAIAIMFVDVGSRGHFHFKNCLFVLLVRGDVRPHRRKYYNSFVSDYASVSAFSRTKNQKIIREKEKQQNQGAKELSSQTINSHS